jgi:hypothetical protein
MKFHINSGNTEICRKDDHKLVYDSSGRELKFKSKGTTLNDNRCRYAGNMDNDCQTD